jgi:hypothetical protein
MATIIRDFGLLIISIKIVYIIIVVLLNIETPSSSVVCWKIRVVTEASQKK